MSLLQSNFEWPLSNGEKILRGAKSGFIQALPVFFVFFLFIYLFIFFWGGVWTLAWMVCGTYFQGLYRVLICRYYSNQQNMAWKQVPVWGQGGSFFKKWLPLHNINTSAAALIWIQECYYLNFLQRLTIFKSFPHHKLISLVWWASPTNLDLEFPMSLIIWMT